MSFIPLDPSGLPSACGRPDEAANTEEVIPAKRVALTDILPLTLVGDQVRHFKKFIVGNQNIYIHTVKLGLANTLKRDWFLHCHIAS